MISGYQTLRQIEDAIRQARAEEEASADRLRALADEAATLQANRVHAFRDLARVRLDGVSAGPVAGELETAERRALALIDEARRALDGLKGERTATAAAILRGQDERDAAAKRVEEAALAIERLKERTRARLMNDEGYAERRRAVDKARAVAAEADKKAQLAEADRIEKSKPFDDDPLFRYLRDRQFGTANYTHRGLTRFLDRWVARMIGYENARPDYVRLTELPQLLREHAETTRAGIAGVEDEQRAFERKALEADGIAALEADYARARSELEAIDKRLREAQVKLASLDANHEKALLAERDNAYGRALDLLGSTLANESLRSLHVKAKATPTPHDERIVEAIAGMAERLRQVEDEANRIRGQVAEISSRRAELERSRAMVVDQRYDRPHVRFGNDNTIGNVIGGILAGAVTSGVLNQVLRDNYSRPSGNGGFGGGFGGGPWDGGFGGDWGGGAGGGGSVDGGGSWDGGGGGDGFRTGGGV